MLLQSLVQVDVLKECKVIDRVADKVVVDTAVADDRGLIALNPHRILHKTKFHQEVVHRNFCKT